jgi:ABC-2 type transport system ATP-binding protein
MVRSRRRLATVLAATLAVGAVTATDAVAEDPVAVTDEVVTSFDGTPIAITIFEPAGASAEHPVPVVLDSHGWAGERRRTVDGTVHALLEDGFGVVSIDQRGHGESGGEANIQDPDLEVRDIQLVIDRVAALPWVQLEAPGDPVLGAIGGSYGGAYQTMTALAEQATRPGGTRFDALVPEITWHDLPDSLAPSGVPRTAWLTALYAAGAPMVPAYVHRAFAEGMATGELPAFAAEELASHGPRHFTDAGVRLDIPVLLRQGSSDNLFNLNQALRNYDAMLTPGARARSSLFTYNGGHALPNLLPAGGPGSVLDESDACTTLGFIVPTLAFLQRELRGRDDGSGHIPYRLTTADGTSCIGLDELPAPTDVPVPTTLTTAGAGLPQYVPLLPGPLTIAGIPHLRGTLTSLGLDARAFLGLAVGTSPLDAKVIQNNLLPLRRTGLALGEAFRAELPGIVAKVPAGQTLYLVVTPVSDQFAAHGSRTPGALLVEEGEVEVPIVRRSA